MADRSRVINLPPDSSIDSSGVGAMLFGDLSKRQAADRDLEAAGRKADLLGGIETKYRQQEALQKNSLATEFEKMQQAFADSQLQKTWAHSDQVNKELGQGILDTLSAQAVSQAQAGNIMPGFVSATSRTPDESTGEQAPAYGPGPALTGNPLGAPTAATGFNRAMESGYAESKIREQRGTDLVNKLAGIRENMITDEHVTQARAVADSFGTTNPRLAAWLRGIQPGMMTKEGFEKAMAVAIQAEAAIEARAAVTKTITEGRLASAKIYADSRMEHARLMAKKGLDKADEKALRFNISNALSQIARHDARIQQLRNDNNNIAISPVEKAKNERDISLLQNDQAKWERRHEELLNKQDEERLRVVPSEALDDKTARAREERRVMSENKAWANKEIEQLSKPDQDKVRIEVIKRMKGKANTPGAPRG